MADYPESPVTREEIFLAKAAGQSVILPEPVSRRELFLAKIAGQNVVTPEPVSREEQYLNYIAEHGSGGGGEGPGFLYGIAEPDDSLGENGDVYIQYLPGAEMPEVPPLINNDSVIFSNEWGSDAAYRMFDGKTDTYWSTDQHAVQPVNQYCGYDFGAGKEIIIQKVGIYPRQWANVVQIKDFKIQASNDGETWNDLYTGTIENDVRNVKWNYFVFENNKAYRYYRLFVLNANTSLTITIFECQFFSVIEGKNTFVAAFLKQGAQWTRITS